MKTKSGSGLIFAVVLLFVILGMVITLASVTMLETKMSQKNKSSVGAFYNSESGVEWALNKIANVTDDTIYINNASLGLTFDGTAANCPFTGCKVYFLGSDGKVLNPATKTIADIKAVRSVGSQGNETQRAVEAAVASGGDYQLSCSSSFYTDGRLFETCCRINTSSGQVECKVNPNNTQDWTTYQFKPW